MRQKNILICKKNMILKNLINWKKNAKGAQIRSKQRRTNEGKKYKLYHRTRKEKSN